MKIVPERGRPTDYTEDLGDRICEGIANGLSLHKICLEPGMPKPRTVYRWRRKFDHFSLNYAYAREDAADKFVDDIKEIADEATPENIQCAKLQCDVRKWTASRFNRAYQERNSIDNTHSGPNGGPIVVSDMSDDELKEELAKYGIKKADEKQTNSSNSDRGKS